MGSGRYPDTGGGSTTLPSTLILADGTTVTTPDGLIERHTTSGTPGVGFGLTDAIELQSAAGNVRRVMTDVTSLTVATDGAEEVMRVIKLMAQGALAEFLTFQVQNGGTAQAMMLGTAANSDGLKTYNGLSRLDLIQGGSTKLLISTTLQPQADVVMGANRILTSKSAGTAVATTIALPATGNMWPLTVGTGTLNSITATGWQAGTQGTLIIPTGVTITHNVAGTGATILTSTAASIVAPASGRAVPISYDGTNWWAQG